MRLALIIIILIFLGIAAAFFASMLIRVAREQGLIGSNLVPEEDIVVAAQSLPAMSVVTSSHLRKEKVPKAKLSQGYLSSLVQAIGRVLAVPVVEGQILTQSCFVTEGTAAQLAAVLPEGMRAFTVTLSRQSVSGGFLYPGCVVDVLASFRLAGREAGEAVSTTLLQEIEVLAVKDLSVVSMEQDEMEKGSVKGPYTGRQQELTVTLMVDSRQAEALQLAVEYGKISLAMRNPLDKRPVDMDATVLSQGQLAKLGYALEPQVAAALAAQPLDPNNLTAPNVGSDNTKAVTSADKEAQASPPNKRPSWLVTVIRGQKVQEQQMDIHGEEH